MAASAALIDGLELFGIGFSWGGFESLALPVDPSPIRTARKWQAEGPAVRLHIGLEDPHDPIGRASCRGRVCQYAETSVVAGSLHTTSTKRYRKRSEDRKKHQT